MPNIRFIDSGTPVGAYGIPKVDNATSSSFATSASFASTAITASHALFAVSASVEITKEVSSSHANRADVADSGNGIFSGSFSGSYIGDGSGLTRVFEGTSASSSISTRLTTQETKTIFSGSFSGSYEGNGSGLTNIPASGIVGLNLSQIASGSATASISPNLGLVINTDVSSSAISTASFGTYLGDGSQLSGITPTAGSSAGRVVFTTTNGELTAESGFEYDSTTDQLTVQSLNVTHLTSSFITASTIQTSGSNIFGDDTTDTQTLIGTTIITGSAQVTGSLTMSGLISIPNSGSGITIDSGSLNVKRSAASTNIATFTPLNSAGRVEINDAEVKVTDTAYGYTAGKLYSSYQRTGEFSLHYWSGLTGVYIQGNANEGGSTWQQNFIGGGLHVGSRKTAAGNSVPFAFSVKGPSQLSGSLLVSGSVNIEEGFNISGSSTSTASFGTYLGDGSQLTGVSDFPFTGNAQVTGSLLISGSLQLDYNGNNNIIIGSGSGENISTAADSIIIGNNAATAISTGGSQVIIGQNAADDSDFDTQSSNVIIGRNAASNVTFSNYDDNNVYIGANAGANAAGNQSVGIGDSAGSGDRQFSVDIGFHAGKSNGDNNVSIGYTALKNSDNTGSPYNVAIGYKALVGNAYSINIGSVAVGYEALQANYRANYSTAVGYQAGYSQYGNTSGTSNFDKASYNTYLGYRAGYTNYTGSYSVVIGPEAASGSVHVDKSLIIGSGSFNLISGSFVTGDIIFANTASAPSFSGSFQGDGSQLTGIIPPFGKFGIANASGEYTYYSDLSSSLQAATAGDTIQLFTNHTESSDHVFHLKDKVDFNFNGNELFISASATLDGADMFSDNDIAVSCSFYNGRIRFTQAIASGIFNRLLYIDNAASEITNIGFEWEVENGHNASPFYPIRNDGTLIGGKFIGGSALSNYLIQTYGTLKHLDVYARTGILFNGYLKKHYNLNVHTYGGQAAAEATNTYVYDSYFHAETGQALSAFYAINCIVIADNGAGITGTRRLINSTIRNANGIGVSLNGEMIGGSVYTENNISVAAAASEVLGVSIYNRDYIGPGVTVSNGEISNCAIIDDYPYSGQKSIEVDSGATTATITNCSFDFLNNSTNNIAITADDDNTPVFFANNTFKNCTPTNTTKVTQAILNTPDAQGNIVINN